VAGKYPKGLPRLAGREEEREDDLWIALSFVD